MAPRTPYRTPIVGIGRTLGRTMRAVLSVLCVVVLLVVVYEFGYKTDQITLGLIHTSYSSLLGGMWLLITLLYLPWFSSPSPKKHPSSYHLWRVVLYGAVTTVVVVQAAAGWELISPHGWVAWFTSKTMVRTALIVLSIVQISRTVTGFLSKKTNPSLILASSFALIIAVGMLLLMLPNSTTASGSLGWIDALFVSTSAVCVTGLSPIDVSTAFTPLGQGIILVLIQVGGLGIMTITSFFGLFFTGARSFSGQMAVGDMLSTERLGSLLRTLGRIIGVTLSIEAAGAVLLYMSLDHSQAIQGIQAVWFSVFHAISAFCNAGFSTLSGNLADPAIAHLNSVRYIIGVLIIFGGIGFPIFSNFLSIIAHKFRNTVRRIYGIRPTIHPRLWNLNTYIVLRTTATLIVGALVLFLALEWNHSLAGLAWDEKLSHAFLMSVTPRTAGFSGVDLMTMVPASIVLTIALMWIGGAPQSTAGGIKVTTFYVAMKNIRPSAGAPGVGRLEVHHRQVPESSVRRAFSVIGLSITVIAVSVGLLSFLQPELGILPLFYEVVSAISTVGLSLATTPLLTDGSKIVVIFLMFAGRVGLVALLAAILRTPSVPKPYKYPEENILIN